MVYVANDRARKTGVNVTMKCNTELQQLSQAYKSLSGDVSFVAQHEADDEL